MMTVKELKDTLAHFQDDQVVKGRYTDDRGITHWLDAYWMQHNYGYGVIWLEKDAKLSKALNAG